MTKMLKELTLDKSKPTIAVLGSREGGGKLMVATTEDTQASENSTLLRFLEQFHPHKRRRRWASNLRSGRRFQSRWFADGSRCSKGIHRFLRAAASKPDTALVIASSGVNHANSEISFSFSLISEFSPFQFAL